MSNFITDDIEIYSDDSDDSDDSNKRTQISSFKSIENKHDVYRAKNCTKKFCEFLREHAIKIINFKKKKNEGINKRAAGIK